MKRFFDPVTEKRISKQKALDIVEETGKMLTKEKMTVTEARRRGFHIPKDIESVTLSVSSNKNQKLK